MIELARQLACIKRKAAAFRRVAFTPLRYAIEDIETKQNSDRVDSPRAL